MVFVSPDTYVYMQVQVNKSRIVPKIYAIFYLNYIAMPFSVKIWCKTGFRDPRHILRYASSGEENSYGAEDLR